MIIKNDQDLKGIIEAGKVAAEVLYKMASRLRPGMTTGQLDKIGEEQMLRYGARSAPKVMYNFPGATNISIIPEVAHGIPGDRVIQPGDLVNIDVSVELDGYYGDNGMSIPVELEDPRALKVCQVCREARAAAIAAAKPGGRINEIGKAVEQVANKYGMHIIKNLCGDHSELLQPFRAGKDRRRSGAGPGTFYFRRPGSGNGRRLRRLGPGGAEGPLCGSVRAYDCRIGGPDHHYHLAAGRAVESGRNAEGGKASRKGCGRSRPVKKRKMIRGALKLMEALFEKMKEYVKMDTEISAAEFQEYYQQVMDGLQKNFDKLEEEELLKAKIVATIMAGNAGNRRAKKDADAKKFKKIQEKSSFWANAIEYKLKKMGLNPHEIEEKTAALEEAM